MRYYMILFKVFRGRHLMGWWSKTRLVFPNHGLQDPNETSSHVMAVEHFHNKTQIYWGILASKSQDRQSKNKNEREQKEYGGVNLYALCRPRFLANCWLDSFPLFAASPFPVFDGSNLKFVFVKTSPDSSGEVWWKSKPSRPQNLLPMWNPLQDSRTRL